MKQKETLRKVIAELTAELDGDLEYIKDSLTSAGVEPHVLFYFNEGDHLVAGFVLGRDGQIYYFVDSEEYDEESPDEEAAEKFEIHKVDMDQLKKDNKIYTHALVAMEIAESES